MATNLLYDGYAGIIGTDGSLDRFTARREVIPSAINRTMRGGMNRTRPSFRDFRMVFDSVVTESVFTYGAINGAVVYNSWRGKTRTSLLVSVHDRILQILIVGRVALVTTLISGLSPGYMFSWFAQGHDRVYWQNDVDDPIGWDGVYPPYRLPRTLADTMPVGGAMCYAQGRLAVVIGGSYVIISDHVYGNGLYDTRGLEKFIEYQYYNDIGAIGSYAELGKIVGAVALPLPDTANGQGPFLFVCENGFWTFDPTGLRSEWLLGGRQLKLWDGSGCPSPTGFTIINNDLFYQAADGSITSFNRQRTDLSQASAPLPISGEVRDFLDTTDPDMRKFVSLAYHDKRLLATCGLTQSAGSLGGFHRFGQGMVALDLDRVSVTNEGYGYGWDGLWTGPNPIQMLPIILEGERRCLILSHDDDGRNRLFEFGRMGENDSINNSTKKIFSSFTTSNLFADNIANAGLSRKVLNNVQLLYSEVPGSAHISIDVRPDFYPTFFPLMARRRIGCEPKAEEPFEFPFYGKSSDVIQSESPKALQCRENGQGISSKAMSFQFRVNIEGVATIPRLVARADAAEEVKAPACELETCALVVGDDTDMFDHKLISSDGNQQ